MADVGPHTTQAERIARETGLPYADVVWALDRLAKIGLGPRDSERLIRELARTGADVRSEVTTLTGGI